MQLEAAFRRSLYLSLAIASLALCISEASYLPEMPLVGGLVGSLLVVAYFLEGRWSLTLNAANTVGMVLTAILGIWIAYQFFRPQSESLIYQLPWPTSLLPYLGPVLLILIPVKLFRPKEIGDYWTMYGLGLMTMALGCAMDEEGIFGVLLVAWLVVFVWSLTLFYLYRESGLQPILAMSDRPEATQHSGRFPLLRRAGRWSMGVLLVGAVCFAITPRFANARWQLKLRDRLETGISPESQVDLTRTGNLNVNEEPAFTVIAEDADGNPKTDLNPMARWRHMSLANYKNGLWPKDRYGSRIVLDTVLRPLLFNDDNPSRNPRTATPRNARLPDLGPKQYYLTIIPAPDQSPIPLVMDPIYWKRGELPPIVSRTTRFPEKWDNWQQMNDTSFLDIGGLRRREPIWCQTRVDLEEPDLSPTMYLTDTIPPNYYDFSAAPNVQQWTDSLIHRLTSQEKLPPQQQLPRSMWLSPKVHERGTGDGKRKMEHHEAIARALCNYLAGSGEFTYSLDLRRKDRRIDPVEDFLYNIREGHCQKFATALVFMLRTQGIPAHFVLGYKGCEQVSPGRYVIRQSHAHAWVEVLIPRPPLPDDPPPTPTQNRDPANVTHYHWLSLDPTPELSAEETAESSTNWLDAAGNSTTAFFRNLVLGFNNEQREKAVRFVAAFFVRAGDSLLSGELSRELIILLLLIGLPTLAYLYRRHRRRRPVKVPPDREAEELTRIAPFHVRLMSILERAGYRPNPSQTAKEFAAVVANDLARQPITEVVASVPRDAAELYYRVRFGNEILSPEDLRSLDASLDRLEASFRSLPNQGS